MFKTNFFPINQNKFIYLAHLFWLISMWLTYNWPNFIQTNQHKFNMPLTWFCPISMRLISSSSILGVLTWAAHISLLPCCVASNGFHVGLEYSPTNSVCFPAIPDDGSSAFLDWDCVVWDWKMKINSFYSVLFHNIISNNLVKCMIYSLKYCEQIQLSKLACSYTSGTLIRQRVD